MRYVMSWIKANPWTVASITVAVLSLAFLIWVQMQGSTLSGRMAKEGGAFNKITGLTNRSIQFPPEKPDNPPKTFSSVAVRPVMTEQLSKLYGRMGQEYTQLFGHAVQFNQQKHVPLEPNLFPSTRSRSLPFQAKQVYLRALQVMLQSPSEAQQSGGAGQSLPRALAVLPHLDAGMPPTQQERQDAVGRVQSSTRRFTGSNGTQSAKQQQQAELFKEKSARLKEVLYQRAQNLHLYAQTTLTAQDFPFDIAPWSKTNSPPEMYQLWEGQLGLWIQQDIARAIARTNHTQNPRANVINQPVKRLLEIHIIPGYVGLQTRGGLFETQRAANTGGPYPAPVNGQTGDTNDPASTNFYASPTGRISNALYDVRHVRVRMIVDGSRLPQLFNNLADVNFMTVLRCQIQNVDEYQAQQEGGYLYGSDDVVEADLLIETVWLRVWTKDLMPKLVREYVGIDQPTDLGTQGEQQQTPMGAPGQGFEYGGGGPGGGMDYGAGPGQAEGS